MCLSVYIGTMHVQEPRDSRREKTEFACGCDLQNVSVGS